MRIRLNPALPIIKTCPVICIDSDPEIIAGYQLDITNIPVEERQASVPSIELYSKFEDEEILVGIALLPIKLKEVRQIDGSPLALIYKYEKVDFTDLTSKRKVCSAVVTYAYGFPNHVKYFQQQKENGYKDLIQGPAQPAPPPAQQPPQVFAMAPPPKRKRQRPPPARAHRRHHKRKPAVNWMQAALMFGWKPLTSIEDRWKEKARRKGWLPPTSVVFSSIAVQCKPGELAPPTEVRGTQTEAPAVEEPEASDLAALLRILNPPRRPPLPPSSSSSPSSASLSSAAGRAMALVRPHSVFSFWLPPEALRISDCLSDSSAAPQGEDGPGSAVSFADTSRSSVSPPGGSDSDFPEEEHSIFDDDEFIASLLKRRIPKYS